MLDESVGAIVDTIGKHPGKNTLIIFCSDNGPQVGFFSAAGPSREKGQHV